ncbi:MAG: hypothetical protein JW778_04280 [Candidatus Altiarchaeota archaeon]|nr:hypothetical protein [Candidatus Altiarchaeota archaeon]
MAEGLEDILRKGFYVWKGNLSIALPFLLNKIVSFILIIGLVVSLFSLLPIPLISDLHGVKESLRNASELIAPASIVIILLVFTVFLFLMMLISSFFEAGAIGMAKKAIEAAASPISRVVTYSPFTDMMDYGSRRFFDLFLFRLIISAAVLILVCLLFGAPILINIALSERFEMFFRGFINLGASLLSLSMVALTLFFVVTPYAIVIGDLGVIDGLRRGYKFFMGNKFLVFIFWFFVRYAVELISYAVTFIGMLSLSVALLFVHMPADILYLLRFNDYSSLMTLLAELSVVFIATILVAVLASLAISIFIISPLTTVWWSMFYMKLVEGK